MNECLENHNQTQTSFSHRSSTQLRGNKTNAQPMLGCQQLLPQIRTGTRIGVNSVRQSVHHVAPEPRSCRRSLPCHSGAHWTASAHSTCRGEARPLGTPESCPIKYWRATDLSISGKTDRGEKLVSIPLLLPVSFIPNKPQTEKSGLKALFWKRNTFFPQWKC